MSHIYRKRCSHKAPFRSHRISGALRFRTQVFWTSRLSSFRNLSLPSNSVSGNSTFQGSKWQCNWALRFFFKKSGKTWHDPDIQTSTPLSMPNDIIYLQNALASLVRSWLKASRRLMHLSDLEHFQLIISALFKAKTSRPVAILLFQWCALTTSETGWKGLHVSTLKST